MIHQKQHFLKLFSAQSAHFSLHNHSDMRKNIHPCLQELKTRQQAWRHYGSAHGHLLKMMAAEYNFKLEAGLFTLLKCKKLKNR